MKKIICILMALFVTGAVSFGQESANPKAKPHGLRKEANTGKPAVNKTATSKATEHKPVPGKETENKSVMPKGKTKKDGSADMRYKENKEPKKEVAGPKKKDGSPDMRYKANKTPKPADKKMEKAKK